MTEQYVGEHLHKAKPYAREHFIRTYNECADDIFEYCYEKTSHRDIAKYLTRTIFTETWDTINKYGYGLRMMKKVLYRNAKDKIQNFLQSKKSETAYSENLWTLTLSQ